MGDEDVSARREAVARVLAGEPGAKVAGELGRTERWVRKWVRRYDPADDGWAAGQSRAPHRQARRTPVGTERLILTIRKRLMADPWAQVRAVAIAWELEKLGVPPPAVWTIDRILRRAGVPKHRDRYRYVPKGTPYPAGPALLPPNAVHQIDLVGPRHLEGGVPFHALNAVDVGRHRAGIEILPNKQEHEVARGLVGLWGRLGVPKVVQFDNGQAIAGRGHHLALPMRVGLALGVRIRLIPFGEPWRNAVGEHFNDTFDKRFFRTERFRDLTHLAERAAAFEAFHNTHHRYSALKGGTPAEWEARLGFTPVPPSAGFRPPVVLPRRGRVEFIRLIRSNRVLKLLSGSTLRVPEELIHRYVTATLSVRTGRLVITRCLLQVLPGRRNLGDIVTPVLGNHLGARFDKIERRRKTLARRRVRQAKGGPDGRGREPELRISRRDPHPREDDSRARESRRWADRQVHVPTWMALVRMHQARGEDG
ncbi:hypothetical protein BH20ACT24_BH20ACT24_06700 [soil metagenome]